MRYSKQLPSAAELANVTQQTTFPITAGELAKHTRNLGFPSTVSDFIQLFPHNEAFKDHDDFEARCEELSILIAQEQDSPHERLSAND